MSSFFLNSPVGRRATFAVEDSCWEQAGSTLTAVRSPSPPPYCTAVVCYSPPFAADDAAQPLHSGEPAAAVQTAAPAAAT